MGFPDALHLPTAKELMCIVDAAEVVRTDTEGWSSNLNTISVTVPTAIK